MLFQRSSDSPKSFLVLNDFIRFFFAGGGGRSECFKVMPDFLSPFFLCFCLWSKSLKVLSDSAILSQTLWTLSDFLGVLSVSFEILSDSSRFLEIFVRFSADVWLFSRSVWLRAFECVLSDSLRFSLIPCGSARYSAVESDSLRLCVMSVVSDWTCCGEDRQF